MSVKTQSIEALFVALVIILVVSPKIVNNIYGTILGRLFFVCVVVFFAMNNTTLGLLVALAIITASDQFGSFVEATLIEGMDNQETVTTPTTIGEDSDTNDTTKAVLTKDAVKKRLSEIKDDIANGTNNVSSTLTERFTKDSKQIPLDPFMNSSDDVSPSSQSMLMTSQLEGFSSYACF